MRPADLTPVARDVMKLPASVGLIFFSIVGAYLLAVLPWSGQMLLARPDFVLIVLVFWTVHEPRSIGQGVAFLDDGTMVVVEGGSAHIEGELDVTVTRILQTVAGRMIFAELAAS